MGRCAVEEGVHEEAELGLGFFRRETEQIEHPGLDGLVVDPDGAATDFDAVDDHVVGVCADRTGVGVDEVEVVGLRRGERVVHRVEAAGVLVPLEEGEVEDPQWAEDLGVAQAQLGTEQEAEFAELLAGAVEFAAEQEQQIAGSGAGVVGPGAEGGFVVELVHAGFEGAVGVDAAVYEAFRPDLGPLDPFGQFVELLAGVLGCAGDRDAEDGRRLVEDAEPHAAGHRPEVDELHAEPDVGLVVAVTAHGLVVRHPREGPRFDAEDRGEEVAYEPFERVQDVFLLHERHLAVDLGELGLPVCAQVLVAEAFDDLVVAVESADHQQLLERLRALRQGVKLPGVHARRHHEVAGPFRRGLDQVRRLDFDELLAVEVGARFDAQPVAQHQVPLHRLAPQVEVAVLHAQVVASVRRVFDGKRRRLAHVQHFKGRDVDLDFARGQLQVF